MVLFALSRQSYCVVGDRLLLFGKNTLATFYDNNSVMKLEPDGECSKMLERLPDLPTATGVIIDREEENTHVSF